MKFTVNADSPESSRLAYRFWIELGRPTRFYNRTTLEAWSSHIDVLYRKSGLGYEDFKWFLIWALRPDDPDGGRYGNNFTATNLRSARDPMASLVKQFDFTFFEVFQPRAKKVIPLLMKKRQEEEAGAQQTACSETAATSTSGDVERCTKCGGPCDLTTSLCLDCLDTGQRKLTLEYLMCVEYDEQHEPRRTGESVTEWIDRVFAPLRDPDWRCPNCGYGGDPDPDAERTAWCPDCAEERRMYADEDREAMCGEVPSVSCLTEEWD